jgi:hypothetical protein
MNNDNKNKENITQPIRKYKICIDRTPIYNTHKNQPLPLRFRMMSDYQRRSISKIHVFGDNSGV